MKATLYLSTVLFASLGTTTVVTGGWFWLYFYHIAPDIGPIFDRWDDLHALLIIGSAAFVGGLFLWGWLVKGLL